MLIRVTSFIVVSLITSTVVNSSRYKQTSTTTKATETTTHKFLVKDPRIVGGKPATLGQFPYQVLIYATTAEGRYLCGGVIITSQHVLTAGHCVHGLTADRLEVLAGNTNRKLTSDKWFFTSVTEIHLHENYMPDRYYNDIAVIKLKDILDLNNPNMAALKLRTEAVDPGILCTVTGWGSRKEGGSSSNFLQFVDVPIVDSKTCSDNHGRPLFDGEICAGVNIGGKDACQGDSGGPMVCEGQLTGVVSWGDGCGRGGKPGVYAKVSYYRSWVEKQVGYSLDLQASSEGSNNPATSTPRQNGGATLTSISCVVLSLTALLSVPGFVQYL